MTRKGEITQNSQMFLSGLPFLLDLEGVIGVLPVHRLLVARANPVWPFTQEGVAWTGGQDTGLIPLAGHGRHGGVTARPAHLSSNVAWCFSSSHSLSSE